MTRASWAERKTVGYIVSGVDGPMTLCEYEPGVPVLCYSNGDALLFKDRRTANKAVRRTKDYASMNKYTSWDTRYKVTRITAALQKGRT